MGATQSTSAGSMTPTATPVNAGITARRSSDCCFPPLAARPGVTRRDVHRASPANLDDAALPMPPQAHEVQGFNAE